MESIDLATRMARDRAAVSESLSARHRATWRNLCEVQRLEERLTAARSRLSGGQDPRAKSRDARMRIITATAGLPAEREPLVS